MTGQDTLTHEQRQRAVAAMQEYIVALAGPGGVTPLQDDAQLDANRVDVIDRDLNPLLSDYLKGKVSLPDFKTRVDSINKRHEYWGFKGIKGQMFFNLAMNAAEDHTEFDATLKAALALPTNEEAARSMISLFAKDPGVGSPLAQPVP